MDVEMLTGVVLDHPVLERIDRLARDWFGIGFSVVFPDAEGWQQVCASTRKEPPVFCRLFLDHEEGRRRCKRFHALAAVASCRKGHRIERCHTGAAVLVSPLIHVRGEAAVLGTCIFTPGNRAAAVKRASRVAEELKLDPERVRRALDAVPTLTRDQVRQAGELLAVAAEVVQDLVRHAREQGDGRADPVCREGRNRAESSVVSVVRAIVDRFPEIDHSVADLARAAGITPNYLSALFRQHTGFAFVSYVQQRRISLAKNLLLAKERYSVATVGVRAGFSTASYFIRCFREQTGQTPLQFRRERGGCPAGRQC